MALNFPNLMRRYDATRKCVRFSGYDGALEKPFFIEEAAIWRLDSTAPKDPGSLLEIFDRHRDRICQAAIRVYAQRREGSYTLKASDF
jgi:hypothetical protein